MGLLCFRITEIKIRLVLQKTRDFFDSLVGQVTGTIHASTQSEAHLVTLTGSNSSLVCSEVYSPFRGSKQQVRTRSDYLPSTSFTKQSIKPLGGTDEKTSTLADAPSSNSSSVRNQPHDEGTRGHRKDYRNCN